MRKKIIKKHEIVWLIVGLLLFSGLAASEALGQTYNFDIEGVVGVIGDNNEAAGDENLIYGVNVLWRVEDWIKFGPSIYSENALREWITFSIPVYFYFNNASPRPYLGANAFYYTVHSKFGGGTFSLEPTALIGVEFPLTVEHLLLKFDAGARYTIIIDSNNVNRFAGFIMQMGLVLRVN